MNEATKKAMFSSATDDWATPQKLFDELDAKYGPFDLDVCATGLNNKVDAYFGPDMYGPYKDGLSIEWYAPGKGNACWMNPPYGEPEHACKTNCKKKRCVKRGHHIDKYVPGIVDWVKKAYEESQKGCLVVCLLPARTDTAWFRDYCKKGEIEFLRGRLKFGNATNSAPFPSMVVVFRPPSLEDQIADETVNGVEAAPGGYGLTIRGGRYG